MLNEGFWLQIGSAAVLVVTGLLLARYAHARAAPPQRSRRERRQARRAAAAGCGSPGCAREPPQLLLRAEYAAPDRRAARRGVRRGGRVLDPVRVQARDLRESC